MAFKRSPVRSRLAPQVFFESGRAPHHPPTDEQTHGPRFLSTAAIPREPLPSLRRPSSVHRGENLGLHHVPAASRQVPAPARARVRALSSSAGRKRPVIEMAGYTPSGNDHDERRPRRPLESVMPCARRCRVSPHQGDKNVEVKSVTTVRPLTQGGGLRCGVARASRSRAGLPFATSRARMRFSRHERAGTNHGCVPRVWPRTGD